MLRDSKETVDRPSTTRTLPCSSSGTPGTITTVPMWSDVRALARVTTDPSADTAATVWYSGTPVTSDDETMSSSPATQSTGLSTSMTGTP